MSFYKRYDLVRLIADGDAKTFRATENATGRDVFVHLFNPSGQALLETLKSKSGPVGKLEPPVLEIGEFAGSSYAVTEIIDPFGTLRDWVESWAGPMPKAPVAPPPPPISVTPPATPAPQEPKAGEFTQLFQAQPVPGQPFRPTPAPPAPPPPVAADQGEFTRLFKAAPARPALPQPSPAEVEHGEFTRLFQAPAPAKREPAAPPPTVKAPRAEPDEFERMMSRPVDLPSAPKTPERPFSADDIGQFTPLFGSGLSGEAIDIEEEQARAAGAKAPENRPFQQAGEFTRMFGSRVSEGQAPPPPPPARPVQASASQLFLSPEQLAQLSAEVLAKPEAQDAGPGEYTRMFGPRQPQAEAPAAPKPAPEPAPAPAPAAKKNSAILIAAIAGVVTLIALVVWLAMSIKR
jgi:hypothetical protein